MNYASIVGYKVIKELISNSLYMRRIYSKCYGGFIKLKLFFLIFTSHFYHKYEVNQIKKNLKAGKKIRVAFLVMDKSVWKTDLVFQAMMADENYAPVVVVIPRLNSTDVIDNVQQTFDYFNSKGYETKIAKVGGEWIALDELIDIDVIFISNPHNLSMPQYFIGQFYKKITCYVPYFEQIDNNFELHFNGWTENLAWKVFQINEEHKNIALKHAVNRGKNIDVVGYPATEILYDGNEGDCSVWKDGTLKKIIIAPHHNISTENGTPSGTFLDNAFLFKELAKKYSNEVCFAFKPHPLLKDKLMVHPSWGKNKVEEYWNFWQDNPNTQLEEGEYVDLFKTSDALIHDCSSFIIEYLYVKKPCIYLNPNIVGDLNVYGRFGFDQIEKAYSQSDIDYFVERVVNGDAQKSVTDSLEEIMPKGSPTEKIMKILNGFFLS